MQARYYRVSVSHLKKMSVQEQWQGNVWAYSLGHSGARTNFTVSPAAAGPCRWLSQAIECVGSYSGTPWAKSSPLAAFQSPCQPSRCALLCYSAEATSRSSDVSRALSASSRSTTSSLAADSGDREASARELRGVMGPQQPVCLQVPQSTPGSSLFT